jgi:site-specific DNA-methyltransferase (adenine-specific)
MKVKLTEIKVGDRQRKIVRDLDKMALSLEKYNLIHPIIVDRPTMELIAGYRRLEAAKLIKWEEIEVTFRDEASPLQRKEIELEENLMRLDLTWQEQAKARFELDVLKKKLYGSAVFDPEGWSTEDTANAIGESHSILLKDLMLAKAMEVLPELTKMKTKTDALNLLKREKDKFRRYIKLQEIEGREKPSEDIRIIHGNCLEELIKLPAESCDMAIVDPPFGRDLQQNPSLGVGYDRYKDSKEDMYWWYSNSIPLVATCLRPGSHCYMFFPINRDYPFFLDVLEKSFEFVDEIPLAWVKSTGGFSVNAEYRYQPRYQPIFFASKGKRKLKMGTPNGNVLEFQSIPIGQRKHPAEAPVDLFKFIIDQSTLPGETILDPFAGSGNSLVAAKEMGRRAIGVEVMEEYVAIIKEKIYV